MADAWRNRLIVIGVAIVCCVLPLRGAAAPFTASYLDGGTWNTLYGQGFNAFVNDGVTEEVEFGAPVPLSRFEFYKSGNADTASNIKLAIISPFYADLTGLTTSSVSFVGASSNTIASTGSIATGSPIRFDFENLNLNFGDGYGAIFVNIDGSGNVTPVKVSALTADYVVADPNATTLTYVPESNYDENPPANPIDYLNPETVIRYDLSTSNYPDTTPFAYFNGFTYGGDANFTAYFDYDFPDSAPGDFDGDDDVDGRDFLIWQRDQSVGSLSDWQTNYGTSGLPVVSVVPEPASFALLATVGVSLLFRRRGM